MITDGMDVDISWCSKEDTKNVITNCVKMAKLITHSISFAKDGARNLYFFQSGVYRDRGELAIEEMYRKYLILFNDEDKWQSRMIDQLIRYIGGDIPEILDRPVVNRINLLNGIYDIYKSEDTAFEPSSPEYLTTIQIPINYNPNCQCPHWDKFLEDVFPEGVQLLQEIIGLCMIPLTSIQKCIVLLGEGSDGFLYFCKKSIHFIILFI